jgi:polyisoprenoid-binding protein YceI
VPKVDASEGAQARVFTYKDGLLSTVAHDLELAVERLEVDFDEQRVTASFDLRSLRVLHAVVSGRAAPNALTASDLRKIEHTLANEVLQTSRHPDARFESSAVTANAGGYDLRGTLTLAGQKQEISVAVRRDGDRYTSEVMLDQRRFGITPYSALLGALKLKPEVRVRVSVPA